MSARLSFSDPQITDQGGLLIPEIYVIDTETGEKLRIAKITPELVDYLKMIEIDVSDYFTAQEMKKKNTAFTKLCKEFRLYT
jgi:hypothetical protein